MLASSRLGSFFVFSGVLGVLGVMAVSGACGSQSGAASGTQCFTVLDCAAGLACVPKAANSSTRICSSNIMGVETMIDSGVDAPPSGNAGPPPSLDGDLASDSGQPAAPEAAAPTVDATMSPTTDGGA